MATPVLMPKQGQSVETCVITGWKKKVGDRVSAGEILCEVETDKAAFEVESPATGTLLAVFREQGEDVPVLTPIAVIGSPGEETESFRSSGPAAGGQVRHAAPAPVTRTAAAAAPAVKPGRIAASPRARALAARRGARLEGIRGTGPGGRIMERDVQTAAGAPRAAAAAPVGAGRKPSTGAFSDVPLSGIRKIIAERMLGSLQGTAQLTLNAWADARAVQAYRAALKSRSAVVEAGLPTINDMILLCVCRALSAHPDMNAHFGPGAIRRFEDVNLGFAVDTPRGLMVPVIKGAQALDLSGLAAESARLVRACRDGRVDPDDLMGGTFTVTNLGAMGIESFTPVLNPPQVGILGVGCISMRPKPGETQGFSFIPQISLSLTIDHQAVDGAAGARFLQTLGAALADFARIAQE